MQSSDILTADVIILLLLVMIGLQLAGRGRHYLPGLRLLTACVLVAGISLRIWPQG